MGVKRLPGIQHLKAVKALPQSYAGEIISLGESVVAIKAMFFYHRVHRAAPEAAPQG